MIRFGGGGYFSKLDNCELIILNDDCVLAIIEYLRVMSLTGNGRLLLWRLDNKSWYPFTACNTHWQKGIKSAFPVR